MKKIKMFRFFIIAVSLVTFIACGPPRLKGIVSIEGDPVVGNTITANIGSLGGNGIITYQWLRDGATAVADTNSYTLQSADRGSVITVTVIRSDNSGSITSAPVTPWGYYIGERGPGGGIIFYVDINGFTMSDTGETVQFLEAAPENFKGDIPWASRQFIPSRSGGTGDWISIEGTETAIGSGRKNTALILEIDSNAPAASLCMLNINGFNDWFLPSRDELNQLYINRTAVNDAGGRLGTWYLFWSSSQSNIYSAWSQNFSSGSQYNSYKHNTSYGASVVRPIRAF